MSRITGMKTFLHGFLLFLALTCGSLYLYCNNGSDVGTGGGNTSEVSGIVLGTLYEQNGTTPAAYAAAILRSRNFTPGILAAVRPSVSPADTFSRSTTTDSEGRFHFDSVPPGTYLIEGRNDRNDCALIDSIVIDSTQVLQVRVELPPETLSLPGTVEGTFRTTAPADAKTVVYISGMNVVDTVDSGGSFILTGLPAGTYQFHFLTLTDSAAQSDSTLSITAEAGRTVTIGSIFSLAYSGNGSDSGTVPVDTIAYETGDSAEVMPNAGGLVKTGHTFDGWNTAPDGNGTAYQPGVKIAIGDTDLLLYAQWTLNSYRVSFDTRGGSTVPDQVVRFGDTIEAPPEPARTGYTFGGWFADSAFTGEWVFSGTTVTADTTLYARWLQYQRQMVFIAAKDSSFQMGEEGIADTVHKVTFWNDFLMDTTEITQSEYDRVMSAAYPAYQVPFRDSGAGADYPVYYITLYDAVLFCNALTKASGSDDTVYQYSSSSGIPGDTDFTLGGFLGLHMNSGYRLPTEAEWEYACRAGSAGRYFWGDDTTLADEYAWSGRNSGQVRPVALKKPNPYGLYDMAGNVAELCIDEYSTHYFSYDANNLSGQGPDSEAGTNVIRGGNWRSEVRNLGSANREKAENQERSTRIGFRICRTAD